MNTPARTILTGLAALVLLAVVTTACSDHKHSHQRGSQARGATVEWPELTRFDHVVHRLEAAFDTFDDEQIMAMTAELLEAKDALLESSIPANAHAPEIVAVQLEDLRSLRDDLVDSENLSTPELMGLLVSYEPIVHTMMSAAGLPHVHHHDDDHDHDDEHDDDDDHNHDH